MSETPKKNAVVPKGDAKATFACGHTSWAAFSLILLDKDCGLNPVVFEKKERCADCLLAHAVATTTACARCGDLIFQGMDCIVYGADLCCLKTACGPGPMGHMPGVWDGTRFVDGITAGTVRVLNL